MKLERILKVAAQVAALALLATSSPLAQKAMRRRGRRRASRRPQDRTVLPERIDQSHADGTPVARLRAIAATCW